jgi:hypothetical protein
VGGVFNTFPYTSFSQNVGLVGVTGVRSRSVISPSARNIPVDSIITTIITTHIVATGTMCVVMSCRSPRCAS